MLKPVASDKVRALLWRASRFDAAMRLFPRFSEQSRQIVRRVLVDGHGTSEVAADFGVTRQRVSELVNFVRRKARPPGWVTEAVTVPPELMAQIRELEREARQALEEPS